MEMTENSDLNANSGSESLLTSDSTPESILYGRDSEGADSPADPIDTYVPNDPADYELTFAESTSVDEHLLSQFKGVAHELGLSRGQAARLAKLYEGHVDGLSQQANGAAQRAEQGWLAELKGDRDFPVQIAHARRALAQYGSPDLTQLLNESRIGSHPAMVRFVARIGKALAEPEFRSAGRTGGELSAAEVLYPGYSKR